jgi:DNA-binding CsgD family transcriptional regulator
MSNVLFEALCASLDHLSAGYIASFADGTILHANRTAHDMMAVGWPIRLHNGYIHGEDRKRTDALLKGIAQVAQEAAASDAQDVSLDICLACTASRKGAAIATLKPLIFKRPFNQAEAVVAIFVTQIGERNVVNLAGIAECFDLTPAEKRTLEQFMEGGTVAEVAQALVISENTVKSHLQNIFTKTSSSRQPQLIKLISELRPPLRMERKAARQRRSEIARDQGSSPQNGARHIQ